MAFLFRIISNPLTLAAAVLLLVFSLDVARNMYDQSQRELEEQLGNERATEQVHKEVQETNDEIEKCFSDDGSLSGCIDQRLRDRGFLRTE